MHFDIVANAEFQLFALKFYTLNDKLIFFFC